MKSILTGFALLACLTVPVLAEEAASPTPAPTAPAASIPAAEAVIPALLPRASAEDKSPNSSPVPASQPLQDSASSPGPMGGGCHHGETVYLTN